MPKDSVSVRTETEAWQYDFRALALSAYTVMLARLIKMLQEKIG